MPIVFRPHHFMCTLGFEGKGYSPEFVDNYARIARELRGTGAAGDETEILVVERSTDSICGPCPNRAGDLCSTEDKIRNLDSAHAKVLGLKSGDRITWGEAKRRISERMSRERFHLACSPCSWKALGVCEAALVRLRENADSPNDSIDTEQDPTQDSRPDASTVSPSSSRKPGSLLPSSRSRRD